MDIAGLVNVRVQADLGPLEKGLEEARQKTESFDRGASGAFERGGRSAKKFGDEVRGSAQKAAAANDNVAGSARRAALGIDGMVGSYKRLAGAVSTLVALLATGAVVLFADTWSDLSARVGLAIKNMDAASQVMDRLATVADRTYSSLSLTAENFVTNATVLRELGKATSEQLDYTESLNLALVVSGARAERAARVQDALGKAMALGKLSGDQLNTVIEAGGRVAEILAEELGVGVNQLRSVGAQGKITGDVIFNSLTKRMEQLREEAELMPSTVGDMLLLIGNAFLRLVGTFDELTGLSGLVVSALELVQGAINGVREGLLLLAANLHTVVEVASVMGVALTIAFGPTILTAVRTLRVAIGTGLVGAFHALTAAMLANPITFIATAFTLAVAGAYFFRDEIQKAIGVDVVGIVKAAANYVIGAFVAAFEDIKFVWNNFGNILGAAVVGGVNIAIRALNSLLTSAKVVLNDIFDGLNMIPGVEIEKYDISKDPIKQVRNPYASRLGGAVEERNAAVNAAMTRDWIGDFASNFKGSEQGVIDLDDSVKRLASSTGEADKAAKKAAEAYKKIVDGAQEFIRSQELEASVIGMTEQAANALRYELEMTNEARRAGIKLTPEDIQGFKALAEAMAEAEERTRYLTEIFDFTKSTIKGFFSDLRSGLEEGKGFWEAFADAGVSALKRIADKLIEMALDQMINNVLRSLMGAFGGSLGGGINYGALSASGRYLFAEGGRVSGPGSSTSDSIPAWLSDGEFVVRAAAVAQPGVLSMLEAINSGDFAARMAFGGLARVHAPANTDVQRFYGGGLARSQPVSHGNAAVNLRVDVQNNSNAQVEIGEPQQGPGGELILPMLINEAEQRMVSSMRNGPLGRATQQTFVGLQRRTR